MFLVLSGLFVFMSMSCLSEIDLTVPENSAPNIAIVSRLIKGQPSIVEVQITGLADFIGFDQALPITDAKVSLINKDGVTVNVPEVLKFKDGNETGTGKYIQEIFGEIPVNIGGEFKIQAIVNNITYESSFEKLNEVPRADSLSLKLNSREILNDVNNIVTQRFLQFFIHTPLSVQENSNKAYLKWDFEGVYRIVETLEDLPFPPEARVCFLNQLLNNDKIVVYNGPESLQDYLTEEFLLEELLDFRFAQGFYLNVVQQSLSEGAYDYWDKIGSITEISGNFFEDPPGKVLGNFTNTSDPNEEVFGYFYTTEVDTVRLYINPASLQVRSKCPSSGLKSDMDIDPSCFDCQSLRNSTTVKPHYWER